MPGYYRKAAELIIGFEGFSATPYGDVNNYRIGFGSSTYMLALNSTPLALPTYNPKKTVDHYQVLRLIFNRLRMTYADV